MDPDHRRQVLERIRWAKYIRRRRQRYIRSLILSIGLILLIAAAAYIVVSSSLSVP